VNPLVLAENPLLAGIALDNIARRLEGETSSFLPGCHGNIFSRIRSWLFVEQLVAIQDYLNLTTPCIAAMIRLLERLFPRTDADNSRAEVKRRLQLT